MLGMKTTKNFLLTDNRTNFFCQQSGNKKYYRNQRARRKRLSIHRKLNDLTQVEDGTETEVMRKQFSVTDTNKKRGFGK